MKKNLLLIVMLMLSATTEADVFPFGKGSLTVTTVARNAVRIQYAEGQAASDLPDWLYVKHDAVKSKDVKVDVDQRRLTVTVRHRGKAVFTANRHQLAGGEATLSFASPRDEYLCGLGQFQDGYANVRGLSRRLTQVNTQISLPMLLSSKGYGVLWNNYGLVDFNPCDRSVRLVRREGEGASEVVNVTTTEGGRQEVRRRNVYEATIDVSAAGDYALLLDVGQKMARRHNLVIDGRTVIVCVGEDGVIIAVLFP